MPIVVSKIRAAPNDKGLSSFPCVTVMHRKKTHMRNVPFSRFIKTEKLMMGIRSTDKNKYRSTSYGIHQTFLDQQDEHTPYPANNRSHLPVKRFTETVLRSPLDT